MASCAEQSCTHAPRDFAKIVLSTPTGTMTVEALLCDLHLAHLEMSNAGQYLFVRPRHREGV